MPALSLQNFVDFIGPKINSIFLNQLDILRLTVFDEAATKAAARTALTSDAAVSVGQGGTGVRTSSALGGVVDAAVAAAAAATVLEAGNTTPAVTPATRLATISNVVPSNITNLTGGYVGQMVTIYATNSNTSLTNALVGAGFRLSGSITYNLLVGQIITLIYIGSNVWIEVSRSTP